MSPRVLLIGGHGKISQLVTPMLLSRSWAVTSLIRDTAQESTIRKLGADQPGKLDVLVRSLEDLKSEDEAKDVIEQVKPDWVIWSAGEAARTIYHLVASGFVAHVTGGEQAPAARVAPAAPSLSTETPRHTSSAPQPPRPR